MSEDSLARADVALNVAAEHPPALEPFFQEHDEGVYGSLCLITRNRHEAEEIAQDAFMKMWERWNRVGGIDGSRGVRARHRDERVPTPNAEGDDGGSPDLADDAAG